MIYHLLSKIVSLPEREEERKEHNKKLARDEQEMNDVFNRKVEAKLDKIKETETALNRNMIEEMKSLERKRKIERVESKILKREKGIEAFGLLIIKVRMCSV